MVMEKAKRLVEHGKDVVILLDSITRLARAYNTVTPPSGQGPLRRPRRQRPPEAQALLRRRAQHRGGRLAHHHRHGPGRHRLPDGRRHLRGVQGHRQHGAPPRPQARGQAHLPRHRHQPSGTRKEELLIERVELNRMWILRKILNPLSTVEAMELLVGKLGEYESNETFLKGLSGADHQGTGAASPPRASYPTLASRLPAAKPRSTTHRPRERPPTQAIHCCGSHL